MWSEKTSRTGRSSSSSSYSNRGFHFDSYTLWKITCAFYWTMTNTSRSDGSPEPDGTLRTVTRKKILHYLQLYLDRPEPMTFMPTVVDTSSRIYDDFLRLLFLYVHRETSALTHSKPEESGQYRSHHVVCLTNIKGSVGLILVKTSAMRISIPLDLSSRTLPLPSFIHSR